MLFYWEMYYRQIYARIPPYLIGIILGFFLHRTKNCKLNWSPVRNGLNLYTSFGIMLILIVWTFLKRFVATGWIVATLVAVAVPHGLIPYLDETKVPIIPSFVRISYGALHRTAWAMAIAWIILACTHGYGGN